MAVVSLIISIIAVVFTAWNSWYKFSADRRERWWARITWALDRFSASDAEPRNRKLAWSLLMFHITEVPRYRGDDDQAMLEALDEYLDSIEEDEVTAYNEDNDTKE